MKNILPAFGIQFVEVERVKFGEMYISASHVRDLIEQGELDKIRAIIPDSTFEYIKGFLEFPHSRCN